MFNILQTSFPCLPLKNACEVFRCFGMNNSFPMYSLMPSLWERSPCSTCSELLHLFSHSLLIQCSLPGDRWNGFWSKGLYYKYNQFSETTGFIFFQKCIWLKDWNKIMHKHCICKNEANSFSQSQESYFLNAIFVFSLPL